MKTVRRNALRGASLRQTVVAVFAVALILMLLSPLLLRQQTNARKILCSDRQRELWKATEEFNKLHGHYPAYRTAWENDQAQPMVGWIGGLLPQLESATHPQGPAPYTIANDFLKRHPELKSNSPLENVYLADLVCPADLRAESDHPKAVCSYVGNTGMPDAHPSANGPADWPANGVLMDVDGFDSFALKLSSREWIDEHDGLNETLLLAENMDAGLWTDTAEPRIGFVWRATFVNGQPARDEKLLGINEQTGKGGGTYRVARPSSHHGRGVNVVYCSGKLQFLSEDVDYVVYANLMSSDIADTKMPGSQSLLKAPYHLEQ